MMYSRSSGGLEMVDKLTCAARNVESDSMVSTRSDTPSSSGTKLRVVVISVWISEIELGLLARSIMKLQVGILPVSFWTSGDLYTPTDLART